MNNSNHAPALRPTRIDMPPEIRLDVITLLNQTLACTVDLRSQVKQACWNVKGKDFAPLHTLFATMATELEGLLRPGGRTHRRAGGSGDGNGPYSGPAVEGARVSQRPRRGQHSCAGTGGAFRALRYGNAERYYARRRCRGRG